MNKPLITPSGSKLRNDGEITRNRILDHAEKLFSIHGLTGVSVRAITSAAKVDLALVNYYFGSKEKLFREVLIRRVDGMSKQRMEMLAGIKIRKRSRETLTELLNAFLQPLIGTTTKEIKELTNYRHLVALVANSKNWQTLVFREHYDPIASAYIDALAKVLPDVAKSDIYWAFNFFLGSVVNAFAETGRIDNLSGGACHSNDLVEAQRQLIAYSVGGFMGLPRQKEIK